MCQRYCACFTSYKEELHRLTRWAAQAYKMSCTGLQEELACSGSWLLCIEMCQRFCECFHYYLQTIYKFQSNLSVTCAYVGPSTHRGNTNITLTLLSDRKKHLFRQHTREVRVLSISYRNQWLYGKQGKLLLFWDGGPDGWTAYCSTYTLLLYLQYTLITAYNFFSKNIVWKCNKQ